AGRALDRGRSVARRAHRHGIAVRPGGDGRRVRAASDQETLDGTDRDRSHCEGGRGMGTSSAETVREIEETRDRIEAEVRELEGRLPKPAAWTKRLVGVAVGGGVGGTLFWVGVRRVRKRRAKKERQTP